MTRLVGLDALRGIAALCVVYFHVVANDGPPTSKGYLAVDFFIMLSGYVMARTYEEKLGKSLSPATFLFARYRRLWPVVTIGTLIGIVVATERAPIAVVLGIAMIPMFQWGWAFPYNGPVWSTSLELLLNAVHALALRRVSNRALILCVIAATISTIPYAWIGHTLSGGALSSQLGFAFLRGLISYPLGILLWRFWQDRPPIRIPPILTLTAMPAFVIMTQPIASSHVYLDYLFVLLICPLLIAGGLQMAPRWGTYLGAMSFPLYAFHIPMLHLAQRLDAPLELGALAAMILAAAYTTATEARRRSITTRKQRNPLAMP